MTDTPFTDVTRDDPLPADEEPDEREQGAAMGDRPDEPEDGPDPDAKGEPD